MADRLPDDDLMSLEQAAPMLRVSRSMAYRLAARGEFPGAMKVGRLWRVSVPKFRRIVHGEPSEVAAS